jgi:RNA polymerase sigma factor (sigma-70 family)
MSGSSVNNSPVTRPSLLVRMRNAEDQRAWSEFVEIYTPLIYGFCRKRGLQEADSADVAQEVMRAVARSISSFDYLPQRGGFRAWLFTITRNKFNNFLEKRRREESRDPWSIADDEGPEAVLCPDQGAAWDQEYQQRLFDWACEQLRGEFTENTWQAFWRMAVEGQSGEAVARALGLSVGAVYVAKSRVRAQLRERIASITGEEFPPSIKPPREKSASAM